MEETARNNVIQKFFGSRVFNDDVMQEKLPRKVYLELKDTIENGSELTAEMANAVAHAMKEWALDNGATHYTHWFQPMTGITAEKHDSFLSPRSSSRAVLEFSGKELIKGEPDASSFPSGGLRATFEARGYTAWDCTSPAFLREDSVGVTLCIPTAFCSYTGEALDKKTPLLRSMEAINKQATKVLHLFGHRDVTNVSCSVGAEQEYFLIDRKFFLKRDDLIFSGRTLFGSMPPKGQELDDHYFGSIRERVSAFMKDLNLALWKLGILSKTQHNESAPAQHEMAPLHTTANIATDHNQLIMETMKRIARNHDLECLLHEKPFNGVNGSGKHNNWSLLTNTGINLLNPGRFPHENKLFLFFLAAIVRAVDEHPELIRMSCSTPGNDFRLGGNEAPPPVISIFIGEQLEDIVEQIIKNGIATTSIQTKKMDIGVQTIAPVRKDATDRNRTSPIAFTGNKFEFRMAASSMSIAGTNMILNTIIADALEQMTKDLEPYSYDDCKKDFETAVDRIIQKTLKDHKRILYNGNSYSEEWRIEAQKRNLPSIMTMVDAIPSLVSPNSIKLFTSQNVLNEIELNARAEINYETYTKAINIEAKTMIQMTSRQYIPAVIHYTAVLADSINRIRIADDTIDVSVQCELLRTCSELLKNTKDALTVLQEKIEAAASEKPGHDRAVYFKENILPAMSALRNPIDKLEFYMDKKDWPVPTYGEMLYEI